MKFDFTADLTGTGNRSEAVIQWCCLFIIVYNNDADLEVSDACVRNSLLSWVFTFTGRLSIWLICQRTRVWASQADAVTCLQPVLVSPPSCVPPAGYHRWVVDFIKQTVIYINSPTLTDTYIVKILRYACRLRRDATGCLHSILF